MKHVGRPVQLWVLTITMSATMGLRAAGPLSPAEEQASFVLADPDLLVELVAAEPAITSPVAVAWDAEGAMFVAEMNDYPTATSGGRIRRLVDADLDGHYESVTSFAEDLHFPSSIQPWRDGILVAAAPDILFLRDTNHDGRADERRVVFSGFAEGNQQLRVNGLTWTPDNWVHGANGRSDGEVRGGGLNAPVSLRRHDFRFRPDSGVIETLSGPSQFGIAFDAGGNRFLSWNTIPIRHEVLPERYTRDSVSPSPVPNLQDCLDPSDHGEVFPLAPPPQTFNRESTRHFNALAGLHLYDGDALGDEYRGSAFVGETLRNLVHRRVLVPDGVTFVARRGVREQGREFLAAKDPWFHPVNFATGPDGALYVCDFYRRWVEHPGFVPESLRSRHDWREGWEHGRIWRVTSRRFPDSRASERSGSGAGVQAWPGVVSTDEALVEFLGSSNTWQRLTAQRLLAERGAAVPVRPLRARVSTSKKGGGIARLAALWALENAGALDDRTLRPGLSDADPRVRRAAMQILETRLESSAPKRPDPRLRRSPWAREFQARGKDVDAGVRLQVALTARWLPPAERLDVLAAILTKDLKDPWIVRAVLSSGQAIPRELTERLLAFPASPEAFEVLYQLGWRAGADAGTEVRWPLVLPRRTDESGRGSGGSLNAGNPGRLSVLAGYLEARRRADPAWRFDGFEARGGDREFARGVLASPAEPVGVRVHALRLLVAQSAAAMLPSFLEFVRSSQPRELQLAAVDLLAPLADAAMAESLAALAPDLSVTTRRRLLALAPKSDVTAQALLRTVNVGHLSLAEIDPVVREAFLKHPTQAIREQATRILTMPVAQDRQAVVDAYRQALNDAGARPGDPRSGARLFGQNCSVCHRLGDRGVALGPDLTGIGSRAPEALLVDLIDPSRQVAPDYVAYVVTTRDHEELAGLLVAESPGEVTLRRPNLPDTTIPRSRVLSLRASGESLMPEGFENLISAAQLPDLLAFLADPVPAWIPAP